MTAASDRELVRYSRQMLCPQIGDAGQRRIKHTIVTIVGCGALGAALADVLARAGVGMLRIIDRDFIELSNLQRQTLFDEQDIADSLPKAEAAARKLRRINSAVDVEGIIADLNPGNIAELLQDTDLLLDGTDNVETRFLLNDWAVDEGVPWVYGACVGTTGRVLPIIPGRTACLRCVWEELPAPGDLPTCDTVGVLAATAQVVASLQSVAAMKIMIGDHSTLGGLTTIDVWTGRIRQLDTQPLFDAGTCPCCHGGDRAFLRGDLAAAATALCGRDALQITPAEPRELDLRKIALRLPGTARAKHSQYMLRFAIDNIGVTVFADGRAIVQGTTDPAAARTVLAKYVGL